MAVERLETERKEIHQLLGEDVSRLAEGIKTLVVDWGKELPLARSAIESALTKQDPREIENLVARFPDFRTLYWTRTHSWRFSRPYDARAAEEVLALSTEVILVSKQLDYPFEAGELLQTGNLYRHFERVYLPQRVVNVAHRFAKREGVIVAEVDRSSRDRALLELFSGIYTLQEDDADGENITPVPFGALFSKQVSLPGNFGLAILDFYKDYIESLPQLVPEGKQILDNVILAEANSFAKAVNNWLGEMSRKKREEIFPELVKIFQELEALSMQTIYNPQWRRSLIKSNLA